MGKIANKLLRGDKVLKKILGFEEEKQVQALSESINTEGLLQPIVVRIVSSSPSKYEIIAGERRLKAAKIAGLSTIPAIVRNAESRDMRRLALTENMQRVDLNIVEKTRVIGEIMEEVSDIGMVAEELGLSRRIIERYLRIYRVIYPSEIFASIFERQKVFGVQYFRVLIIAPSLQRMMNLKKTAEDVTHKIFWFTTINKINGDSVCNPVWHRASHDGLFPLVEC